MANFQWLTYDCNVHGYITCVNCGFDTPHYANDVQVPCGTQLTSMFDGTVVRAGCANYGGHVFIELENKMQWYVLHLSRIFVNTGQYVRAGIDVIGLSGGDPNSNGQCPITCCSQGCHVHVGFFTGFKNGLYYGPDITPYISQIRQSMGLPACNQSGSKSSASNSLLSFVTGQTSFSGTASGQFVYTQYQKITDTSPITDIFVLFDDLFQVINPMDVTPHYALRGIGGLLDPVDWVLQVTLNLILDFQATVLRVFFALIGIYILFKVLNRAVNITGKLQTGAKLVGSAAALGIF